MKTKILIFLFFTALFSCDKEKCHDPYNSSCDNYDPCLKKTKTTADFTAGIRCGSRYFEVDVASTAARWVFIAKDTTADEYIWEIGSGKYYTKSVSLSDFPYQKYIPIKLTVKRYHPDTLCYPNDKGVDTMTKIIYSDAWDNFEYYRDPKKSPFNSIIPPNTTTKTLNGKFRGFNKRNPSRNFTMEFYFYGEITSHLIMGAFGYTTYGTPGVDIVNIPYEGISVLGTFYAPNAAVSPGFDGYERDGIQIADDGPGGELQATQVTMWTPENTGGPNGVSLLHSPFVKYYAFFRCYVYLDAKDKDKLTMEYCYLDSVTRKVLRDTFIGNRVP